MEKLRKSAALAAALAIALLAVAGCDSSGVEVPAPASYTVAFDGVGATTAPKPATLKVTEPAKTVGALPSDPAKTGFTFGGWWTGKNGGGTAFTATTPVTANITVYAKWTAVPPPASCVIKFDATGGSGTMSDQTMTVANPQALKPNAFTKDGYRFIGWATEANGIVAYADEATPTVQEGTITLYAKWQYYQEPAASFTYTVSDGKATLTSFSSSTKDVVIPPTIGGYPVVSFGEGTQNIFQNRTNITSVTIPDSVTAINARAFSGCTGLTSVTIPDSVTAIGDSAFLNCKQLSSLYIPDSVTTIGTNAFYECTSLATVRISNSVTSLYGVFIQCTGLKYITIPNSVTTITGAFAWCTGLTSVTIPTSVTTIGSGAFRYCTKLSSVSIPPSVTTIEQYAFESCTSLTSIIIPNFVTTIGFSAFGGCTNLTSVAIPDSVTTIDGHTFGGCYALTSVTLPRSLTAIVADMFSYCTGLTSITIPEYVTSIGNGAFSGCSKLTTLTVKASEPPSVAYQSLPTGVITRVNVPLGAKAAYEQSSDWSTFKGRIYEE